MNSLYCALLELFFWRQGQAGDAEYPGSFIMNIRPHSEYPEG